jgi:hypothetical protein
MKKSIEEKKMIIAEKKAERDIRVRRMNIIKNLLDNLKSSSSSIKLLIEELKVNPMDYHCKNDKRRDSTDYIAITKLKELNAAIEKEKRCFRSLYNCDRAYLD